MAKIDDRQIILNIVSRYAKALKQEMKINSGDIIEDQYRLMKLRRAIDLRIEPQPFQPSEFNSQNPLAREIMETGIPVD